jgi:hypothetical protein
MRFFLYGIEMHAYVCFFIKCNARSCVHFGEVLKKNAAVFVQINALLKKRQNALSRVHSAFVK